MTKEKKPKKQSTEDIIFEFIKKTPFCVKPKTIAKQCKLPLKKAKGALSRLVAKKRIESTSTGSNFTKNRKTYYGVKDGAENQSNI